MPSKVFRIGSPLAVNESELRTYNGFDLLFGGHHEFVYIADFDPWVRVNGTWQGALGYLLDDTQMDGSFDIGTIL
jgi:hypothetical protein